MTVHHVAVEVRAEDTPAELAFWALLGFASVPAPEAIGAAWVEHGGTQIHLLFTADPVVPATGHVAVVCPDYAATTDALRAAGHEVDPRRERWGVPRCLTRTPAGHRVEVMAAPPS